MKNLLRLWIFIFCLCNLQIALADEVKTYHVDDMPLWKQDEYKNQTLYWVTPPQFRSTSDKLMPDVMYKAKKFSTIMYPYHLYISSDEQPFALLNGWSVVASSKPSCLEKTLVLKNKDGEFRTFLTQKDRNGDSLSKRLSCLGGNAHIYHAVYLNSYYIAFLTAEPGWIFFNHKEGYFLPYVLSTNTNHNSNLYITYDGQVIVDIQVNDYGKTNSTSIDRKAEALREIVFEGKSLQAPIPQSDIDEVQKIQLNSNCAIEKKYNRICKN